MKARLDREHAQTDAHPSNARAFRIIAMLAFLFGGGAILFGIQHALMQRTAVGNAKDTARRIAKDQAAIIDTRLQKVTPIAESIAADLTSGALNPNDVGARLRKVLEENPDLFEAGIAYVPNGKAPDIQLFAPHVSRDGTRINAFQLQTRYDYTTYDWYKNGMAA